VIAATFLIKAVPKKSKMVSIELPFLRVIWFIISSVQLGGLLMSIRVDSWYWNTFKQELQRRKAMAVAKDIYGGVGNGGDIPFFELLIMGSITVQALALFFLFLSHRWPESATHTHGSASGFADLIQLLTLGAGVYDLVVNHQPAMEYVLNPPKFHSPLKELNNLTMIAQVHLRLFVALTFSVALALVTLKPSQRVVSAKSASAKKADTGKKKELNSSKEEKKSKTSKKND